MADKTASSGLQQAAAASACAASIVVAVSVVLVARRTLELLSGADRTRRRLDDGLSQVEPGIRRFSEVAARFADVVQTAEATAAEMRRSVDAVKRTAIGGLLRDYERAD